MTGSAAPETWRWRHASCWPMNGHDGQRSAHPHLVQACVTDICTEPINLLALCACRCNGRVQVCVTVLPAFRPVLLDTFASRAELVDACLASAHVPFFMDGKFAASIKGASSKNKFASSALVVSFLPSVMSTVHEWYTLPPASKVRT